MHLSLSEHYPKEETLPSLKKKKNTKQSGNLLL